MPEITRRAEIDMIGYDVGNDVAMQGVLAVRWAKLTYSDDTLLANEKHRAMLYPGQDVDAAMAAVNVDLTAQGYGEMPASDIDLVKTQAAAIWTPDVVAAWQSKVAAEQAAADAQAAAVAAEAAKYLEPWRFWTVVNLAFPDDGLRAAIRTAYANDPTTMALALAKLDNPPGGKFFRDDPMFADPALLAATGKTAGDIDTLWAQGQGLPG